MVGFVKRGVGGGRKVEVPWRVGRWVEKGRRALNAWTRWVGIFLPMSFSVTGGCAVHTISWGGLFFCFPFPVGRLGRR